MTTVESGHVTPVLKVISVKASVERAFDVFTRGFDTWWPREHHIGKSPMTRAIIEQKAGGRCYSEQVDGTDCPWGQVLVWEPPRRVVIAWQITPQWQFEPDLAKSSEVEISFTAETGGTTRVQLEHRHFERHGDGAAAMKGGVDSPNGWGGLLALYARKAEEQET
jgi:uncharacterized protein YndB with AHSA1/START domain